jgi:hypothetical protein
MSEKTGASDQMQPDVISLINQQSRQVRISRGDWEKKGYNQPAMCPEHQANNMPANGEKMPTSSARLAGRILMGMGGNTIF